MSLDKSCSACGRRFQKVEDFYSQTSRWRICENHHLWFNCTCGSTNIIRSGKFPWYDPAHNLSPDARSLFNQLPRIDRIPRLPTRVMELQMMLSDESTDSNQLAAVSREDPVICAMILRIANIKASSRARILSLPHAISFVGFAQMRDIVLLASLNQIKSSTRVFSKDAHWRDAFLIGTIAEMLAQRLNMAPIGDVAYIAGCLCNVGKIVTSLCYPEVADLYALEMDKPPLPCNWTEMEVKYHGFQHTVMGEIGSMFWGLPEEVSDVIAHHHTLVLNKRNPRQTLIDVVALANQFAHWTTHHATRMNMGLFEGLLGKLGISHDLAERWNDEFHQLQKMSA